MNDLAPIFRRVAAINPVPDETDLPANVMATTALLDVIDERTGTVQTQQRQTKSPKEGSKRRGTGVLVASAAFAVVIVVGGVVAFTGGDTDGASSGSSTATQEAPHTVEQVLASDVAARFAPNSMADTIGAGALLTVDRSAYDSDLPERLDIVVYADARKSDVTDPPELVTRVIGLAGETIESRDGKVYVDDRALDEPYLQPSQVPMIPFGPVTLGADELWLMGDRRADSSDSRFRGPIAVSLLRGKVTDIANP